jgi:hypothetical protein
MAGSPIFGPLVVPLAGREPHRATSAQERVMSHASPERVIDTIRATVQSMEAKLRRGDLPEEGLADLKGAIDDARLRLWAMLSAKAAPAPEEVLLRFRLRRATEICRQMAADLERGALGMHQRELLDLREAATTLCERVTASIRGGP